MRFPSLTWRIAVCRVTRWICTLGRWNMIDDRVAELARSMLECLMLSGRWRRCEWIISRRICSAKPVSIPVDFRSRCIRRRLKGSARLMTAHRRPAIDFIITFNRINTRSICSITIDVLDARRRTCIMCCRICRAKIIARVAVVAIDARRCIFREESILAHVFVNGLNLAVFALARRRLLLRHKNIVVRFVLALDYRRIDRRRWRADQVFRLIIEQLVGWAGGGWVAQRRRMKLIVVDCVVVDARRWAADNDLRRGLHHALIELLHLVEGGRCGGEIVCRSIVVLCGVGA